MSGNEAKSEQNAECPIFQPYSTDNSAGSKSLLWVPIARKEVQQPAKRQKNRSFVYTDSRKVSPPVHSTKEVLQPRCLTKISLHKTSDMWEVTCLSPCRPVPARLSASPLIGRDSQVGDQTRLRPDRAPVQWNPTVESHLGLRGSIY